MREKTVGEDSGLPEEKEEVEVDGSQGLTTEESVGHEDFVEDTRPSEGAKPAQPLPQPNMMEPLSDFRVDSKQWRSSQACA